METQVIAESSLCNSEAMLKMKKLSLRWRDLNLTVLARVRIGCSVLCVLGEDVGQEVVERYVLNCFLSVNAGFLFVQVWTHSYRCVQMMRMNLS